MRLLPDAVAGEGLVFPPPGPQGGGEDQGALPVTFGDEDAIERLINPESREIEDPGPNTYPM